MRPFFGKIKKNSIYGSSKTIKELKNKYTFCFNPKYGYKPIIKLSL